MIYDYLIVGSGLYGATCAYELKKRGLKVLVVEKRNHIGGNVFTKNISGINVHMYGAHIFHTNKKEIWNYINQFAEFNNYINQPIARYKNEIYNLPFNMNTFAKLWNDVYTPKDAMKKIEFEKNEYKNINPSNLEEQAINLVGATIYEKLIKGYTAKQWGRSCTELPSFIIKRIPIRFKFDNNYFDDKYQGIPIGGYTQIIEKMLSGVDILLNTDYLERKEELNNMADNIIYSGPIDAYFDYKFGKLNYRSLKFEIENINNENYQGNAVVNYTDINIPYTRIIEHKFFEDVKTSNTIISKEYPVEWNVNCEPYYPINDDRNTKLYNQYYELSKKEYNVHFGGRLGQYKYYNMDDVILDALSYIKSLF